MIKVTITAKSNCYPSAVEQRIELTSPEIQSIDLAMRVGYSILSLHYTDDIHVKLDCVSDSNK